MKLASEWIFLTAGPSSLRFLHEHLCFPSHESAKHWFKKDYENIREGELRVDELIEFLNKNKYPNIVWLSEDATKITGKMEYDSNTDEIIGLVKPINGSTGLPMTHSFPATSPATLQSYSEKFDIAQYVNVVLITPLCADAKSFVLLAYGTNNNFDGEEVQKRANYIKQKLSERGICLIGTSTDAYSAYLKSNKDEIKLGRSLLSLLPSPDWEEFWACDFNYDAVLPIQDPTHELTKLRNRSHKPSCPMSIGNLVISITDLQVNK